MKFHEIPIAGARLIEWEPALDERGFFARIWCREEFLQHGLNPTLEQCSLSSNRQKGTLRGMHYQCEPHQEAKLVRCCSGAIYDVILDLRKDSPTYRKWYAAELTPDNQKMLYVPEGCAHGFQSLAENTQVFYQISAAYRPECARGVRWDDPAFAIRWPISNPILSDKDRSFPDYKL
jgi:dTDP-4-dehydrorhamnose 3,5-epimerase